jgi:hypothetical protein
MRFFIRPPVVRGVWQSGKSPTSENRELISDNWV